MLAALNLVLGLGNPFFEHRPRARAPLEAPPH